MLIGRTAVFLAMALVLIMKLPVLQKMFDLSLWPDMTFYLNLGLQPGVALPVLGSILTQVGGVAPLIQAILVLLSLVVLTVVVKKLCPVPELVEGPAIFAFLFIAGFDYSLHVFRAQGLLYSQTLGLIFAALAVLGWMCVREKRWNLLYVLAVVLVGYPFIGIYSLIAALAVVFLALSRKQWAAAVLGAICIALLPLLYTHFIFTHIDTRYTFLAGFPYMDFVDNHRRFIPLILAMASLVIVPLLKNRLVSEVEPPLRPSTPLRVRSIVFAVVAFACIIFFSYRNRNFHLEIAMQQAIERNDWDKVLKLASKSENPTRIIIMYRNIALFNKGQLCDRMFTYPNESIDIDTPAQISQTEVCAPTVFFYNGLINYSTRWAWEMSMMFQRTLERYKYQAKVALFTGKENPALVEKYLDIIGSNLWQRKWVEKYRSYLQNPALLENDPEYAMFKQLDRFEEVKYMSSAVVENTVNNHYLLQEEPDGIMLDLSLASAMTMKDIDMFWYYYDKLLDSGRRIPTHVGEAAILFAYIGGNQAEIDAVARDLGGARSSTVSKFIRFSSEASASQSGVDPAVFKKKYGDTYWYYSYFVKSLTTN